MSKLYKSRVVDRDLFGRRKALARELEQTIKVAYEPEFPDDLEEFLPTEVDLEEKETP